MDMAPLMDFFAVIVAFFILIAHEGKYNREIILLFNVKLNYQAE